MKVRNLTYYIYGKNYDADSLFAHVNNDPDTHKDIYKDETKKGEHFQEERVHVYKA